MTDNPFASFAAVPAASLRGGGGDGGGGWMTSRKVGKDDTAIKQAKAKAAETRKANRRGPAKKAAGGKKKKKKKNPWSDESEEEEFDAFSEEEDDGDFVVHSDEEEDGGGESDDEGEWGSDEDDDSDFGGKKKGKKKKSVGLSRSARAGRRAQAKATWRAPPSDDEEEDEIEESPAPPPRGRRGKTAGKKKVESPMSVESGSSADDIFASGKKGPRVTKGDGTGVVDLAGSDTEMDTPVPQKRTKQSKYFASDFGEEKKDGEDDDGENLLNGVSKNKAGKKRKVLDSEDEDDDGWDGAKDSDAAGGSPNPLDDTPFKASVTTGSLNPSLDDYADDDEARALEHAMKESMKDQKGERKRLKKGGKGGRAKKGAFSSSLEAIKQASPAKERPVYKDDLEGLKDSDDDDVIDVDEAEEYEAVDEEEQTAAQVLAEANALSAKIVKIVSGWCGGLEKGDNVKGLILGETEGALNLGGGGGGDGCEKKDEAWISNEAMKELLPNVTLAEYQLLGVNWMALLNRTTFGTRKKGGGPVNGILADEMGLGKTVQTIAFLAWLNQKGADGAAAKRRPHLIVVPASVLSNWMNEFQKFAPEMKVVKYHGSLAERSDIRSEFDLRYLRGKEPLDAVLTTFSYFSSDNNKQDRSFLRRFDFDYLVCDEGHTLKNAKGLRYRNLNKFKTDHRLLLTGTPVQNSPKELMSLLTFLMPLFDRKAKSSKYDGEDDDDDGGERMLEYFVQLETDGSGADANANAYRKLKQLFAPFVLRRKKDDVLSQLIPPKTRKVDIVPMDEAMRAAYDAILASHVKARAEKGSGAASASESKHLFTELRKSANHPLLLRNRFKSDEERQDLALRAMKYGWFGNDASCTLQLVKDELDKHSDYEIHCAAIQMIEDNAARRKFLERYTLLENDLFCSPKFKRLRTLLPELIGKGHRILIFSQWTKILDLMQHLLHALDMSFLRLDGSTAVSERQDLIDTFNTDSSIPIFLLSTRAGGMGLNLTAADVAILHDLDFNPFNDRQAEDRCHRIGQKKPVTIIKLVTQGTVDEDIYSIQERKARMNEAIMEEGGGSAKNGNDEMCRLANAAVERFLKSPKRPAALTTSSSAATSSPEDAGKTDQLPKPTGGGEKDDSNADPSIPPESDGGEEKQKPTETADTKSDESKPKKPQSSICWSSDEDSDEEKQQMKTETADTKSNEGKLESKSKAATKPISGWGSDDDDSDEDDIATNEEKDGRPLGRGKEGAALDACLS